MTILVCSHPCSTRDLLASKSGEKLNKSPSPEMLNKHATSYIILHLTHNTKQILLQFKRVCMQMFTTITIVQAVSFKNP